MKHESLILPNELCNVSFDLKKKKEIKKKCCKKYLKKGKSCKSCPLSFA